MSADIPEKGSRRYSRIGRYDISAHIATGGVAAVYKAVDVDLGREVALKILPPDLAAHPLALERFRREARNAAKLRHDHIVSIYELGEAAGTYYLALEYVDGQDLLRYIEEKGRLDAPEALEYLAQIAQALQHLHGQEMVHRDVKPSNILRTEKEGQPLLKLSDLGLARVAREEEFRVTQAGFTVGTIDYMAPEQARDSASADIRSDIYALGCTWFHMLAGHPPFAQGGLAERLYQHMNADPPDIRDFNPGATTGMMIIMTKMLAKKPEDRYQTPDELLTAIEHVDTLREPAPTSYQPPQPKGPRKWASSAEVAPDASSRQDQETVEEMVPEEGNFPQPSPEQRQAAAGQFDRAKEVLANEDLDYGIHLLLSCCKLDPGYLTYRRMLRKVEKAKHKNNERGSRLAFLANSPAKTKIKAAKAARDYLKVLEYGEEVLVRNPWDVPAQIEMAEAAESLGLYNLGIWLLEQAIRKDSSNLSAIRNVARLYERRGRLAEAIAHWEQVRKSDPNDLEASRKTRDLAIAETIVRAQFSQPDSGAK
jgi:serine/threonine protein kinase